MDVGLRLLKALNGAGFWRVVGRVHTAFYRASGGRLGGSAAGITNLLLTTTGRKSGAERTVALAYFTDGPRWVLVASNGGADRHPAWWLNLRHRPEARVQIGAASIPVAAREATGAERARLWPELTAVNPFYARYERMTARAIPVVILERRSG